MPCLLPPETHRLPLENIKPMRHTIFSIKHNGIRKHPKYFSVEYNAISYNFFLNLFPDSFQVSRFENKRVISWRF